MMIKEFTNLFDPFVSHPQQKYSKQFKCTQCLSKDSSLSFSDKSRHKFCLCYSFDTKKDRMTFVWFVSLNGMATLLAAFKKRNGWVNTQ